MRKSGILLVVSCLLAYMVFVGVSVRHQAQKLAGHRAFCVQVGTHNGYKAVTGVADTVGLWMMGFDGHHHAALIVGDVRAPETYHWSYWSNQFVPGTYGPFPVMCETRDGYFDNLPEVADGMRLRFALDGRMLSIPKNFHPQAVWPGSMVGYGILATAPLFSPADEFCGRVQCNMVHVAFRGGAAPRKVVELKGGNDRIEDLGTLHGLSARRLVSLDGRTSGSYQYFSETGKEVTHIHCLAMSGIQCLHLFTADGMTYSFHHMPEELPRWRSMQERLIRLNASFQVNVDSITGF